MPKINSNNLGYLGIDFQYKLVKCFFEDKKFFNSINHIVDQNMFTEDALRRIVGYMKDRYAAKDVVSTYFDIETIVRSKISDNTTVSIILSTLDTIKNMPLDGMDLVEEETEKFFKQQNLTKAINQSMDIIKQGNANDYYVIEDIVRKALETNTKQDYGFRVFDSIEADLADDYRQPIPTGTPQLDSSLYGGLGKGELGLIVAPMGVGKALPLNARVMTPTGYTLMGDIKVGDKVIGRDGNGYNVIGIYPQVGKRPVYKVTFSNGTSCECDEEHLWNVSTGDDEIYETLSLKQIIESGLYNANNGYKFNIPSCKPVNFEEKYVSIDLHEFGCSLNGGNDTIDEKYLYNTREKRELLLSGLMHNETVVNGYNELNLNTVNDALLKQFIWLKRSLSVAEKKYITKVEYVRDDYTQCIMVDSPDHLYVIEDFIVTHNTSIVTGFAAAAATHRCELNNFNGFKVLHYFHEDEEAAIRRKYFGYVLNIDACELSKPDVRPLALSMLQDDESLRPMIQNNIICKRLISGETTASQIKDMIRANIAAGFKPDLVIIDYFECLKPEKATSPSESEWSKEAITMRKLEAISHEFNIAIWVPVQGTKDSIGEEFVGLKHAGGSVRKTQIGHVVLTLARTEEQKSQQRMNVYIQKLRAVRIGRDKFMNVKFNNGTCKFDMEDIVEDNDVDFDNPSSQNMQTARRVSQTRKN